jgi:hypothetical protein
MGRDIGGARGTSGIRGRGNPMTAPSSYAAYDDIPFRLPALQLRFAENRRSWGSKSLKNDGNHQPRGREDPAPNDRCRSEAIQEQAVRGAVTMHHCCSRGPRAFSCSFNPVLRQFSAIPPGSPISGQRCQTRGQRQLAYCRSRCCRRSGCCRRIPSTRHQRRRCR